MNITDVFNNIPTTKAESAEEKMEQEESVSFSIVIDI